MKVKKTPLYGEHLRLKAKMVEFAGYEMPLQYSSIIEEVKTVRESVGIFDVSHMGEIFVSGKDAIEFANYLITNDLSKISFGDALYTVMCNEDGGIIDDTIVYKVDRETVYFVVNAANREKDFEWMKRWSGKFNVKVEDRSDDLALIAVQGPKSEEMLQEMASIVLKKLGYYKFTTARFRGIKATVSRTGYTGEDGFELMVQAEASVPLWRSLLEYGEKYSIKPAGLGARDVLRLEAGYLLYGNDMDEETNPLEVGLSWVVKLDKEDFIGKEALLKIKESGVKRKIVGLILKGRNVPRKGFKVFKDGKEVGLVTSGTFSPTLGKSIALSIVSKEVKKGDVVEVEIRGKRIEAEVVKPRFYRGSVKSR